jgi:hypothetical protein
MKKLFLALAFLLLATNVYGQAVPPGNLLPVVVGAPGCPTCLPVVVYDVNGNPVSTIGGGMSAVTANAPLTGLGTPVSPLGITQAGAGANGYLSSTDWNTFNGKQSALTFSNSVSLSGSTVTLTNDQASPGPSKYYGTDTGGAKGYFALPTGTSGATVFTGLLDVPNSYVGKGDFFVKVNTAANGLTFVQPPGGAGNVTGPVSATDSQLVLFSGTSGTLLKGASGAGIPKLTGAGVLSSVSTIDTADITNSAVTFAKFQNISSGIVLGRTTTAAGVIEQLSPGPGITFVSGTITNSGVVSVVGTAGQINTSGTTGNITLSLPATLAVGITGNAATATALATNGTNCGAGQAAQGVDAAGNAEGCFTPPGGGGTGNVIGPATNTINRIPQWSGNNNLTLKDGLDVASSNSPSNIVQRDPSGNFSAGTITATLAGNATTATALAANGTNCSVGQAAAGVDASGNAEGCFTPSGAGNVATAGTLTSGQLVIGQGAQSIAVGNLTGDVTTTGSTATTIANLAVTNAKIAASTIDLTTKVTGLLPAANINQANNYAWTGTQDMSGATSHTIPIAAGATPSASGQIAYNSTTNTWRAGVNGVSKTIAMTDSNITGNAATATALAADGTNCSAGQAAAGIDAAGNAQGCFVPSGSGNVLGPGTNTDSFIPQWNGANSNTLKNGLAVASINTASAVVQRDGSGNFTAGTITATLSGTATSLAVNGTNCSAGQFPLGVDASGNAESCTALPTTIAGTTNQITASGSTGAITLSIPASAQLNIANLTNLTSNGVVTTSGGTGAISVTQATNLNTVSTIVQRDSSGNFSAGTITATLNGTATSATSATTATSLAANGSNCTGGQAAAGVDASGNAEGCFTPGGSGDVLGPATNTINFVPQWSGTNNKTLANGLAVTNLNTISTIVQRDASGNFSAGTISANLSGNATTATALQTNGANCPSGQFAQGVDTTGGAEGCTALPTSIAGTTNQIAASGATGAVTLSLANGIIDGSSHYCADAGTTQAYACTLAPAPSAYITGAFYVFKANTANTTGAASINFNSLGAKTIVKLAGGIATALVANDIRVGQVVELIYDGTNMQMTSQTGNVVTGTPAGSDTQVQYNNAGALAGSSGLTYTVGTTTLNATNLTVGNVATNSMAFDTSAVTGAKTTTFRNISATVTNFIASGTVALGTSAIASGACATAVTSSGTGIATTDVINVGFNGDPTGVTGYGAATTGALQIVPYPSTNTVNVKVCNPTSASITPGALTLNWVVVR